jgi:uncharacterized SAM-binding protein YcdF (DUF218 family)
MLLLYLKTILRQLLLPPAGPLLTAMAGLLLLRRRPRLARALLILGLGSLWLLSTPLVADSIAIFAQHYPPFDPNQSRGAQAIVILGGGGSRVVAPEYAGRAAADSELLEKLVYGAWLARQTGLPILLTGNGDETDAMRATLRHNFDIEPRWLDQHAYDTFENARNAAALLRHDGIERIILLTRATHMYRSVHEFEATGLAVIPAAVDIRVRRPLAGWDFLPNADALSRSYESAYELIGEPVRVLLAVMHLRRQQ